MKSIVTILIVLFTFLNSYSSGFAGTDIYCCLHRTITDVEPENPGRPIRHRLPSAPLSCVISQDKGVEFLTVQKPEILCYQIEDIDGNVYTYGDEPSFIDALFSMSGEVSILMVSENCNYIGYVKL